MGIQSDRVPKLDARDISSECIGQDRKPSPCRIHVEPQTLRCAECGKLWERVDRARRGRPCRPDHEERFVTVRSVARDRLA